MPVEIANVVAIRATRLALLVKISDKQRWIPQAVIHDDSEVWRDGDAGKLVVLDWFAEREGLD